MSLIDEMLDACVVMNKKTESDGQGGTYTTYEEGAGINVAIVNNTSMSARIAQKEGVTSTYTLTFHKGIVLEYHDVIKRLKDGKIFRVTSDYGDVVSPDISTLNMCQVSAEKWELTSND